MRLWSGPRLTRTEVMYSSDQNQAKSSKVSENYLEIIKLLASTCHNPDCQDFDGNTPLHLAVEENLIQIVKGLVPFYKDLNIENKQGDTPVMSAKFLGHTEIVQYLNEQFTKSKL